jgi:hypothetical protein
MSDQPVPLCHLTLTVGWDEHNNPRIDGVPCVGSRCAAWSNDPDSSMVVDLDQRVAAHRGMCGLVMDGQPMRNGNVSKDEKP